MNNWIFDSKIEKIYNEHVLAHIPNYERVIQKSLDICQHTCTSTDLIIDIGCANGSTLKKLHDLGFRNLYGVESSKEMIENFDESLATIIISNQFPKNVYKVVLANWVLHFIKNKEDYLKDIYDNLDNNGTLILSEKTNTNSELIYFYHLFKRRSGVTEKEIFEKSKSLENVMFVNSIDWYTNTLKSIGFKNVEIIDADWCFTTFYIKK